MGRLIKVLGTFILGASLAGWATALELPSDGELVLVADGQVVGSGEFHAGDLHLELLASFTGFAELIVSDDLGNSASAEVMIDADGTVVFTETLEDLADVVVSQGGELTVRFEHAVEARAASNAFGAAVPSHVELPETALEGMARAQVNHAAAVERSRSANPGEGAAEGRAEGDIHGEARGEGRGGHGDGSDEPGHEEHGDDGGVRGDAEAGASFSARVGVGGSRR